MNLANKLPFQRDSVQLLLFWRWPLAATCALAALVIEIFERPHLEFGLEAALDVVVLPAFLWIVVTLLAKAIVNHSKLEQQFNLHRQLTESLDRHQDWDELIQFVTKFMGTYLSAERVSLHVYDHREARFEFVAEWHTRYGSIVPEDLEASDNICHSCWRAKSLPLQFAPEHTGGCVNNPDSQANIYCLPLSHSKLLVGVLRMRLPPDQLVDARQTEFMGSIASELALALALSMAQSRRLTQVHIQAHRDERRQVAYELHDSLAQQIAYLHFGLAKMAHSDGPADLALLRKDAAQYRDAARAAYDQVRNIVSDLRLWEAADLSDAIAACVQRFERDAGLNVVLTTRGRPAPLPVSACQSIVGVVQESLNNVQQHARAQRVEVTTKWEVEDLKIEIDDDGVGFETNAEDHDHWGLIMMRERINRLAGQFEISSAPGKGTRLTFTVPLKPLSVAEGEPQWV